MKKIKFTLLGVAILFGLSGITIAETIYVTSFEGMYPDCTDEKMARYRQSSDCGGLVNHASCDRIKEKLQYCTNAKIQWSIKINNTTSNNTTSNNTTSNNTIRNNNSTNYNDKQSSFDREAYYNSEEYKKGQEEIRIKNEKIKKINEKFCYNYPESYEFMEEADNCIKNHVCIDHCGDSPILALDEENFDKECILDENKFSEEENKAFSFLCKINVISDTDINKANLHTQLTRAEMAQLISSYALKFLQKMRSYKAYCGFRDVYQGNREGAVSAELAIGIADACQLNLMGVGTFDFNPHGIVKRADFGTVLSRMLRQDKYNISGKNWYEGHLNALKSAGIMNNIDPEITEQKARVLLMLYRNSQNFLGKSINDRERKPSDYYEPGMTEEEKDAFDEYYSAQGKPYFGVTL